MDSLQSYILGDPSFKQSRLKSLYSDFSHLKEANPEGYRANIAAWKTLLQDLIENNSELLDQDDESAFDSNTLVQQLSVNSNGVGYKPKGLDQVLDSMVDEDHSLVPNSEFRRKPVNVTGSGNGFLRSILSPLLGAAYCNSITNYSSGDGSGAGSLKPNEKYISLRKLRKLSKKVKALVVGSAGGPLLKKHVFELAQKELGLKSKFDFEACLLYLTRDTNELEMDGDVVYLNEALKELDGDATPGKSGVKIGEMDEASAKAVADLNYSIYHLEAYCERKELEVQLSDVKLRQALKKKQMASAKSQLRIKKGLEKQLKEGQERMEQMQILQMRIEEAQNNRVAVDTLESNSKLLKELNKQVDSEKVDEMMDEYQQQIDDTNDVSEKLGGLSVGEDDELERELEEIEKEEEKKEEKKEERKEEKEEEKKEEKKEERKEEKEEEKREPEKENVKEEENVKEKVEVVDPVDDLEARFKKLHVPDETPETEAAAVKQPVAQQEAA